jgi:hypothetical protein
MRSKLFKIGVIFSTLKIFTVSLPIFLLGALATHVVIFSASRIGVDPLSILIAIASFAISGWGVACGVGMLKMRKWTRTSVMAFAAILLIITIAGATKMIFDRTFGVTYLEGVYVGSSRPEMIALLAWFAALGGFWLYFFTRNTTKTRFVR